jgi:flavin reductase
LITQKTYRDGMARLGAAVNIITTDGPGGRAGFTASAVCSVTDAPPTLLVCLKRGSSVHGAFEANGVLCVNTLAPDQEALSGLFGGKTPAEERFAAAEWTTLESGSPVLVGAVVSFDCRVTQVVDVGTHGILIGEVLAVREGEVTEALMYFSRAYHRIGRLA